MSSFRSMSRQPQLQTYSNIHKRPNFRGPQPTQRKTVSVASSSVYDPDESAQRNVKLTLKQAITLITLRLGRLEVMANESKLGGVKIDSENSLDKDFLLSLVTRMDNMEQSHHNLRVEVEKNRQILLSVNEALENLDIQDEPVILEIIEKLEKLEGLSKLMSIDEVPEPQTEHTESDLELEVDPSEPVTVEAEPEPVEEPKNDEIPEIEVIEKPKAKKRGKKVVI